MNTLIFQIKTGNLFKIWGKNGKYNNNFNLRCVLSICLRFICDESSCHIIERSLEVKPGIHQFTHPS